MGCFKLEHIEDGYREKFTFSPKSTVENKGNTRIFRLNTYPYGFQGQEADDELKGKGNSYNYTFRMHDPRIGRFFAVDPLASKYPWYTPYQFSGNKVIHAVELEGLEEHVLNSGEVVYGPYSEYTIDGFNSTWDQLKEAGYEPLSFKSYTEDNSDRHLEFFIDEPFEDAPRVSGSLKGLQVEGSDGKMGTVTYDKIERVDEGVGDAEGASGYVPLYGSGRDAINDFQNGRYFHGAGNAFMAITDIFLVKSLVTGGGKLLFKSGVKTGFGNAETTFYRAMSNAEFAAFKNAGGLTYKAGTELFVSTSSAYSKSYLQKVNYDVVIEFTMKPGAMNYFKEIGIFHRTAAGAKGWASRGNLLWKSEKGALNLGIQQNTELFNPWIQKFEIHF